MKKYIKYILVVASFYVMASCSPSDYDYVNLDDISIESIDSVSLKRSHSKLIADGYAQIELTPILYTKERNIIPPTRVKDEWLEYSSPEVSNVSKLFSTSDKSLIGKTVNVTLKIKGKNFSAEPVSFEVIEPQSELKVIEIPIVFHIVQTNEDIQSYGGAYDNVKIYNALDRLNYVFGGAVSRNAVGVDTKIKFVPAIYDYNGRKMSEKGINRVVVNEIDYAELPNFAVNQKITWPAEKYMNIWLISDRKKLVVNFGTEWSMKSCPQYVNSGAVNIPQGLVLRELDGAIPTMASGIFYRLQLLNELSFSVGTIVDPGVNELIHYVGVYFGLMDTFTFEKAPLDDYCADTHDYSFDTNTLFFNLRWFNEPLDCFFQLENIMDDPSGVHRSISKSQSERIRWVLNNCPDKSAWKSNFAVTGK